MNTYDVTKAYADSVWADFGGIVKDDIKCGIIEDVITMTYDNGYEHPAWKEAIRTCSIYKGGKKNVK